MVIRVPDKRNAPDGYAVLDDRLLVLDFQAGNPQAFVEIHRRYGALARHVCQRFLPLQQDVDEAFQETMIRVFQGLYRFNGRYALQPWIARIAKNVSLDILRGHARRPKTDDSAPASDELQVRGDEADEIVDRLVQRDTVLSVMADLPETHRRALMLREFEGRSHREVAQELEISTSQAKALIHRAKGSFRRLWLEKVADRGGLMGVAFLPLLWLARFEGGLRRVADRVGFAAQSAQAAVPEVVTSTVSATAAPAASSGMGERLVAAGMTLLVAGGVTVGAAKVVNDRIDDQAVGAVATETVEIVRNGGGAVAPGDQPADDPFFGQTPPIPQHLIEAEPPILIEPSPSPTIEPSPSPVVEPVVDPAPEPSPSPEPSPTPEPSPSPVPPLPPPAPAWDMTFSSNLVTDATCDCVAARLIRSKVEGTPGEDVSWYQVAWGPVHDGRGDAAWSVAVRYNAQVKDGAGAMQIRFKILAGDLALRYQGTGILTQTQTATTDDGGVRYLFLGSYYLTDEVPEDVVAPRQGQLSATIHFWSDGTPYLGEFALSDV